MAGNRDRLRSMSRKNVQEVEKVKDVPTLISDVAERDEDAAENKIQPVTKEKIEDKRNDIQEDVKKALLNKNIESQDETQTNIKSISPSEFMNLPVEEENQKVQENIPVIVEKSNIDENIDDKTGIQQSQDNSDKLIEENSTDSEDESSQDIANNADIIIDEWQSKIENFNKLYQGPEVIISLLLRPEANNYLTYKAMDLRISAKQLLRDLLIKELAKGYFEDGLCPQFRTTQHQTIKRSIVIDKQLKEDVINASIKYRMKYTSFIHYVIYKAYLGDVDYKELM